MSANLRAGITLMEIVLVVAIFLVLFAVVLPVGVGFYRQYLLTAERDNLVAVLRRARSQAMSNYGQSNQGVSFQTSQYVIFRGASYAARLSDYDLVVPHSAGITLNASSSEIVFQALDGSANVSGTIGLSGGATSINININGEGRIDW